MLMTKIETGTPAGRGKHRPRRAQPVKIVTVLRGRVIEDADQAEYARMEAAAGVQAGRIIERARRPYVKAPEERQSVRRMLDAIEARLVEAVWTINRLPDQEARYIYGNGRHGVGYVPDYFDRYALALANGGRWEETAPRPAPPSSRAIDRMDNALDWLQWLPELQARIVTMAATTKCGDPLRNVRWSRVRDAVPQCAGMPLRTLQRRYHDALRIILDRLTSMA